MEQLAVGDTLLLTFADLGDRLTGVLVGKKDEDCLLVYAELPDKTRSRVRKNPAVTVQFAFESTLLGFNTRITPERCASGSLLSLAWPGRVENMDVRSEKRLTCLFQGNLRLGDDIQEGDGKALEADCLVEDISQSALRVRLLGSHAEALWNSVEQGQAAEVSISALDPSKACLARCSVLRPFRKNGHPYMVLLLDNTGPEVRALIRDYMGRVLGEPV